METDGDELDPATEEGTDEGTATEQETEGGDNVAGDKIVNA
jgi:hypothetical protein